MLLNALSVSGDPYIKCVTSDKTHVQNHFPNFPLSFLLSASHPCLCGAGVVLISCGLFCYLSLDFKHLTQHWDRCACSVQQNLSHLMSWHPIRVQLNPQHPQQCSCSDTHVRTDPCVCLCKCSFKASLRLIKSILSLARKIYSGLRGN